MSRLVLLVVITAFASPTYAQYQVDFSTERVGQNNLYTWVVHLDGSSQTGQTGLMGLFIPFDDGIHLCGYDPPDPTDPPYQGFWRLWEEWGGVKFEGVPVVRDPARHLKWVYFFTPSPAGIYPAGSTMTFRILLDDTVRPVLRQGAQVIWNNQFQTTYLPIFSPTQTIPEPVSFITLAFGAIGYFLQRHYKKR